jgi:hypothetical protein
VREALLLDLGAIIFELHRQRRREPELLQAKAAELDAVDAEVRALAHALDGGSGLPELTASGLVASCTSCGSLMGSGDRFCPRCGGAAGTVLPASDNGASADELPAEGAEEGEDGPALGEGRGEDESPADSEQAGLSPGGAANGSQAEEPGPAGVTAGGPPGDQEDLVKLAQSKLRAGRRAARRWLAQRRPESR